MQIYADVTGRPMKVSRSAQTCALGAAIAGAVVAAPIQTIPAAQKRMTGLQRRVYRPAPRAHEVYRELYPIYRKLHDAFGTRESAGNLHDVMKQLHRNPEPRPSLVSSSRATVCPCQFPGCSKNSNAGSARPIWTWSVAAW